MIVQLCIVVSPEMRKPKKCFKVSSYSLHSSHNGTVIFPKCQNCRFLVYCDLEMTNHQLTGIGSMFSNPERRATRWSTPSGLTVFVWALVSSFEPQSPSKLQKFCMAHFCKEKYEPSESQWDFLSPKNIAGLIFKQK